MAGGIGPIANLQGKVNGSNELLVAATVTVSGADGSILDGLNPLIKATVTDLANSNPQAVAIVDANGDQITSFGGGTQYAQGSAATTTDTLTMAGGRRSDVPSAASGVIDGDRSMFLVDSEGVLWTRARQQADGDSGAGSVPTDMVLLGLPASGGPTAAIGNSGNKSDATLRVVLATDQPALTNALLVTPGGNVAHDAVDSGNPLKVGGFAATSLPTAVAAADRTNLLTDVYGRPFVRHGSQGPSTGFWNAQHAPAANTKATITKASAGAGLRNVCTSITVSLAAGASAPAAIQVSVALIDGASGGTTYLWGPNVISLPAVAGATSAFIIGQCWKPGTAATGLTLEFSAAGGASTIESVSMDGTTVAE